MTAEDWRLVPGFPDYWVSSGGHVVSLRGKQERELIGGRNQRGYRLVGLRTSDGRSVSRTVHRLVALAFLGEPPPGLQVRHLDGDKLNNTVSNLTYGTASQNILDQVAHGKHHYANKTHCPQGHPYSVDNTYIVPSTRGRMCRTCMRNRQQRQALRAAAVKAA